MISTKRLAHMLSSLNSITSSATGITRLAYSKEHWQAREFILQEMTQMGLSIRIDAFGNIFGKLPGSNPALAPIWIGSHLDSVPEGGNYDGAVGVLAALEILRTLKSTQILLRHSVEAVVFMCEESSRFGAGTLGSRAICGDLSVKQLQTYQDNTGCTLYEALKQRNLQPERIDAVRLKTPPAAFFEIHIEQGPVLEAVDKKIGLVTGIAAPTRFTLHLLGKAGHSGATPMPLRQDALCCAAQIILATEQLALQQDCVATVGTIELNPNSVNVIPGRVSLSIEIRSLSAKNKKTAITSLKKKINVICEQRKIQYDLRPILDEAPVALDQNLLELLKAACRKEQIPFHCMPSGAGHDALQMARACPTALLFIPCRNGLSHHPQEFAAIDDIVRAAQLVLTALLQFSPPGTAVRSAFYSATHRFSNDK